MVQGVKRMIDFISRPLLKSDSIYREIRAVNSEHQMNKNRDVRRKWQIFYLDLTHQNDWLNLFIPLPKHYEYAKKTN